MGALGILHNPHLGQERRLLQPTSVESSLPICECVVSTAQLAPCCECVVSTAQLVCVTRNLYWSLCVPLPPCCERHFFVSVSLRGREKAT